MTEKTSCDEPSPAHPSALPSPRPTPSTDGERLAGYRVLRRASDRFGGTVCHGTFDGIHGLSSTGESEARTSVTLVTFGGEQGDARAMRLIERLEAAQGECVPRVLDVCVDSAGDPIVVLDFCGDALSSILAAGVVLGGGEVVTLAAPVLASLTVMHDRGFAHGAVSLASIAVGTGGRPVLLGWEEAIDMRSSGDRRERDRRAGDDLRAFADLLVDLAGTVADPSVRERTARAADSIRSGADTPFSHAVRSADEVRVFEIADPTPLTFAAGPDPDRGTAAARAARSLAPVAPRRSRDRSASTGPGFSRAIVRAVRRGVLGLWSRGPEKRGARAVVRWLHAGGRSRRIVAAGLLGAATAIVAAVLLPSGAPTMPSPEDGATQGLAASATRTTAAASPSEAEPTGSEPAASAPPPASVTDDAVAGTATVLDAAAGCVARPDPDCWAGIVEPGTALLVALEGGGEGEIPPALLLPVEALSIEQSEDFGDARLITVTPPDGTRTASVLMIRTEAGWRLRELFET